MWKKILLLLLFFDMTRCGEIKKKLKRFYDQYDPLLVGRCDVRCAGDTKCIKTCISTSYSKPGLCPNNVTSLFDSVCMEACKNDGQCPEVQKCCRNGCGVHCQNPEGLEKYTNIPDIPRFVNETNPRQKRRTFVIRWSQSQNAEIYLLEQRHISAKKAVFSKNIRWIARVKTKSCRVRLEAKPGRKYQYRVAALSNMGQSKGFSQESNIMMVTAGPRKPNVTNITIDSVRMNSDNTFTADFHWDVPSSDLPIRKYKVSWSERLQGAVELDSVLVNRQIVPKDRTSFRISNLKPNSSYFLQVRAFSQFGDQLLKGEHANYYLNTTDFMNITTKSNNLASWRSDFFKPNKLNLDPPKLFWSEGNLKARIQWFLEKPQGLIKPKFSIAWKETAGRGRKGGKAITTENHFDLFNLHFKTTYRVIVKTIYGNMDTRVSSEMAMVTISIPSCKIFQKNTRKKICNK